MNLNEFIFTDGQILSHEQTGDQLTLEFRDYLGDVVYICFFGVTSYENLDGIGYDLAGHKLSRKEPGYRLELFDDEEAVIFYVEFDSATY